MRMFLSIALGLGATWAATTASAQTLFSYGSYPVSKEEFLRIYKKNNNQQLDYSKASVDECLDLYSLFRMKVKEAEELRLDTLAAVNSELDNYRTQLARTYLTDKEVGQKLIKEAHARLQEDVRASHILVTVKPYQDTTAGYQKIDSIYKAIVSGKASFEDMARQFSDDKGSGAQGGDIGYVTALQVVYPFENAMYETAVGQVSKPFRSQFGFHILKVTDKRKSRGQVQVAQIMIAANGDVAQKEAIEKIRDIKSKIQKGASFEEMVAQYSEDKFTKDKGGLMEPFGVGKWKPAFEEAAFALKQTGDLSEPVETEYGVHLLKLVKRVPNASLESMQDELKRRVENDGRSSLAKERQQEKAKKKYGFKEYPEHFEKLLAAITDDTYKEKGIQPDDYVSYKEVLFEIGGTKYDQYGFMKYVDHLTRGRLMGERNVALRDLLNIYQLEKLQRLEEAQLQKENPDFRNLVQEYRDGILLFDLMDKRVWSKASKDTTGLQTFFQSNQGKYQWKPGFEGVVYQSGSEKDLQDLGQELASGLSQDEAVKKLVERPNDMAKISKQEGRFEFERFPVAPEHFEEGKAGKVFRNEDGSFSLVFVSKIHANAEPKKIDEARGYVVADYQDYLEKQWNAELRKKYPVKVEDKVIKSIIKN